MASICGLWINEVFEDLKLKTSFCQKGLFFYLNLCYIIFNNKMDFYGREQKNINGGRQ